MKITANHIPAIALAVLSTINSQLSTFGQGSLTPPGPPAQAMKTLAQIEPRLPISALPFTITNGGSYYVTTNLVSSGGQNGIVIDADDVTLDLNGFFLKGNGASTGILVTNLFHQNLVVQNGTIRNWGSGVDAYLASYGRFEHLTALNNATNGLYAGDYFLIADCLSQSNGNFGIFANGGTINDCIASYNGYGLECDGAGAMKRCTANNNTYFGIYATACALSDCVAQGNGSDGLSIDDCSLTSCSANVNKGNGMLAHGWASFKGCVAYNNTLDGFRNVTSLSEACTLADCVSLFNSNGITVMDGSSVMNCTSQSNRMAGINVAGRVLVANCNASGNGGTGIVTYVVCKIRDCVAGNNTGFGISAGDHAQIEGCHVNNNTAGGILASDFSLITGNDCDFQTANAGILVTGSRNRVEANHLTRNGRGLDVSGTNNIILRNTASGNTTDYNIVATNKVGVIIAAPNSGAISGSMGGSGLGTTDPSANFSF